jgi:hypothetical protein
MKLSKLVLAATLIVYGLINLAKIHWGLDVVYWLLAALGVVYALEEVLGHPAVVAKLKSFRKSAPAQE